MRKLELGHAYHTDDGINVAPVKILPNNRAVFVTDDFEHVPYVIWYYHLSDDDADENLIYLYNGRPYASLIEVLTVVREEESE